MVRLKLREIVNLIKAGKEKSLDGYIINWRGPAPCELYNEYVPKEKITITGNDLPLPDKVRIVGVFEPIFTPSLPSDLYPLDFGNIDIRTGFALKNFTFEYSDFSNGRDSELMEFLRKSAETPTGRRFRKADICFNVKIEMDNAEINVYNAFFTNVDFQFGEDKEVVAQIVADLVYDYVHINFTDDIKKRGD